MVQHQILQQAITNAINQPDFTASLPLLSEQTWMKLLTQSPQAQAENERLEFVGDALMYATVGRQLYSQLPNGTPHLYTCVRAVLHSNATFSLLAEKLDIMAVSNAVLRALTKRTFGEGAFAPGKTKPEVKATADLFETVIGAYYFDRGFEALCAWVEEIYTPLIKVVAETFYQHQHGPRGTHRGPGAKKRTVDPFVYRPGKLTTGPFIHRRPTPATSSIPTIRSPVKQKSHSVKKLKTHASRGSTRPSAKLSIIGTSNVKSKVLLTKVPSKLSQRNIARATPVVKKTSVVIDLTLDSDSDSDDSAPLVRHPLVTPRISRPSPANRKRPTPASVPPPKFATELAVADTGDSSLSDSEDEVMLETMLTTGGSCSDMDCESSDVEWPMDRPLNLAQLVTQNAHGGNPLDIVSQQR
ncbi:ribonuclease III domain-containing protein [Daedaleopsis nitida]|nr:ribonuclease III domain-containing protein [Daedaleopsis nitida]